MEMVKEGRSRAWGGAALALSLSAQAGLSP